MAFQDMTIMAKIVIKSDKLIPLDCIFQIMEHYIH